MLNVYATLAAAVEGSASKKEAIIASRQFLIENLMHEFGHILEEWLDKEVDEEFIEKAIESYMKRYGEKSYEKVHGKQFLTAGS